MIYGLITNRDDEKELIKMGCQRISYADPHFANTRRDAIRDIIADQKKRPFSVIKCLTAYDFATSLPKFRDLVQEVNYAGFSLHILDTGARFTPQDTQAINAFMCAVSISYNRGGSSVVRKRRLTGRPVGRPRKVPVA